VTLGRLRSVAPERRHEVRAHEVACPMADVVTAAPDDRLVDLLPRLNECGDGRVLVMDDGRLVGLVTPTDVTRAIEIAGLRRGGDSPGRPGPGPGPAPGPVRPSSGPR
jgi:CBS-domain-containing membrane protein